jgi:peptide/nickel transport system permease protein
VLQFVLRRVLLAVPALLGVYTLIFVVLRMLPGDPAAMLLAEASASREDLEQLRESLGLNRPLLEQYLDSLGMLLRGDLGHSITYNQPVGDLVLEAMPYTIRLAMAGLGLAVALGMTLGTIAALHHNRWPDNLTMAIALGGVSIPSFWLALMAIFLFSLTLGWLPITEGEPWKRIIMPAITIALYSSAVIARLTRSSLLEVIRQDYVLTARAKGLPAHVVTVRHALRNALIPVVTIIGVEVGVMLSGTVVIEVVFARHGMGSLLIHSILHKDFPLTQSLILIIAFGSVLANLAVDVAYGIIDPRIRLAGTL